MSSTLLNISNKVDPITLRLCSDVRAAAAAVGVEFVVVGASARDMVLHYGYGMDVERATTDIDFGVEVKNWDDYQSLRQQLMAAGFGESEAQHTLYSPDGLRLDIIPFGGVEAPGGEVLLPPDGNFEMTVLGFREALVNAELLRVGENPLVDIPVVTPVGLAMLKLLSWMDRSKDKRGRDATDFAYVMRTYARIPEVETELYENRRQLLERCEWDIHLAGARCLGESVAELANKRTRAAIVEFFEGRRGKLSVEVLRYEMTPGFGREDERTEQLLKEFIGGFGNVVTKT